MKLLPFLTSELRHSDRPPPPSSRILLRDLNTKIPSI